MFARTYAPSKVADAIDAWHGDLTSKGRTKIASVVADPRENPELFEEGWEDALGREKTVEKTHPSLPPRDIDSESSHSVVSE